LDLRGSGRQWKIPHNESFITCTLLQILSGELKSRRMRWAGHVAHLGEMRNAYKIFVGKPEGKKPLCRPRHRLERKKTVDSRKQVGKVWIGFIWLVLGTSAGCCEHNNEPLESITCGVFLD
jgi:hypothetical protein